MRSIILLVLLLTVLFPAYTADTARNQADILTLFADGQPAASITLQDIRDYVVSILPATKTEGRFLRFGASEAVGQSAGISEDGSGNIIILTGMLKFLGTTSSFPALRRNGVGLEVRLADDSAATWLSSATHILSAAGNYGWSGRSKIYSGVDGSIRLSNAAGNDFSLLQFGGITSSFPALKRSTTELQVRLADDSADAPLSASILDAITGFRVNGGATSGQFLRGNATNFVDAAITAADLPTAIDAAKIADGSVSNTEFQYINSLGSNAQDQIDGKQPLDAALTALAGGSDFVDFAGPASATKTFTLPNANATLLYSGGALGTPASGTLTNATGLPGTAVINTPAGDIAAVTAQAAIDELDGEKEGTLTNSAGLASALSDEVGNAGGFTRGTAGSGDDCVKWDASGNLVTHGGACGGSPGADSIGTSELDDGADTPASGEWVQVDADDQAGFTYRTDAEALSDIGAQASDTELGEIAALSCSNGEILKETAGSWACAADAGTYANRGNTAVFDRVVGDFTIDATWRDWDISAIVGAKQCLVLLRCYFSNDTAVQYFGFRHNGFTDDGNGAFFYQPVAGAGYSVDLWVQTDANGVIEYFGSNGGTWAAVSVLVRGCLEE